MSTLLSWDFSEGDFDWQGDFADYPSGEDDFFQLDSGLRPLPNNLGDDTALFITGDNRSDDLFMYFRREINGLEPNTDYEVNFDIELASNAPDGSIGIGGSPANSVFLKAGVTLIEPLPLVDASGDLRLNIDKGNQANSGTDSVLLGDIAKPESDTFDFDYEIIERTNQEPFVFSTDDSGSAWLYFGTDSGFEGTTALYYTNFAVDFTTVSFDTDIYRFQSDISPGSYLFTGGSERQNIHANLADSFTEEGLAFTAASQPDDDLIAFYRFRSDLGYILVEEQERASILGDDDLSRVFKEEGLVFYAYATGSGEGTVFNRLRNLNVPGAYLYATGDELTNIQNNLSGLYFDEGTAFEAVI